MKRIGNIIVFMMLLTMMLLPLATAGSEENPEIEDYNENDPYDIFGTFVRIPGLFALFRTIGMFPFDSFAVIDIQSAWFYEQSDNPTYLFTALKLEDVFLIKQTQIYSIKWTMNGKEYSTSVHSDMMSGIHTYFNGGDGGIGGTYGEINGSFDVENNIIYFTVPKDMIGNPQPGDILTETNAWTALRFGAEPFTIFFGGELAKDWSGYGKEYVIQY
jgi:hypothetical protein